MPGWEINAWGHTLQSGRLHPAGGLPAGADRDRASTRSSRAGSPATSASTTSWTARATARSAPASASAWITWYVVLLVGGGNDIVATHFHLSINTITWFVPDRFFVVPVLVVRRHQADLPRACSAATATRCCTAARPASSSACRTVSSSRCTSRSTRQALHTLTAHEQPEPLELGPDGRRERCRAQGATRSTSCAAKLSQGLLRRGEPDPQADHRGVRGDHQRPRPPLIDQQPPRRRPRPDRRQSGRGLRRVRAVAGDLDTLARASPCDTADPGAADERC